MEQKKTNQERTRKYGGSSSFVDAGEPSKAPRQDEDGSDLVGSTQRDRQDLEPDVSDSVDIEPKQQGGNRGGV
jgi:hypothetical protein